MLCFSPCPPLLALPNLSSILYLLVINTHVQNWKNQWLDIHLEQMHLWPLDKLIKKECIHFHLEGNWHRTRDRQWTGIQTHQGGIQLCFSCLVRHWNVRWQRGIKEGWRPGDALWEGAIIGQILYLQNWELSMTTRPHLLISVPTKYCNMIIKPLRDGYEKQVCFPRSCYFNKEK